MADKKISELTAITGADTAADDFFIVVDTSGSATKKISRAELNNAIEQDVLAQVDITSANIDGGTIDNTPIGSTTASTGAFTTVDTTGDVTVGGNLTVQGTTVTIDTATTQTVDLGDNDKIRLGDANDLQIWHDGSNSFVKDAGTGSLRILGDELKFLNAGDNQLKLTADTNGAVKLYYSGAQKAQTTTSGLDVTGSVTADDNVTVQSTGVQRVRVGSTDGNGASIFLDGSSNGDFSGGDFSVIQNTSTKLQIIGGTPNAPIELQTHDGSGNKLRQNIASNGDISFYDSTGVTQGLYWDASTQRLGINTTAPAKALHVDGGASSIAARFSYNGSISYIQFENDTLNNGYIGYDNSGNLELWSGGSEKVTITSGGNVGIGTASPATGYKLEIENSTGNAQQLITAGTNYNSTISFGDQTASTSGQIVYAHNGDYMRFDTNASEAMRIDSTGNLLVGTTSPVTVLRATTTEEGIALQPNGQFAMAHSQATAGVALGYFNRRSSDGQILQFRKDGTEIGSIGTASSYIYMANGDTGIAPVGGTDRLLPVNGSGAIRDAAIDMGYSGGRFRDLYLSGGVYVGGTANPNYFDDYEEGTWTPSFNLVTVTHTVQYGRYIKIGKMVHCKARIEVSSIDNTDASGIQMTVPISANSAVANGGAGTTFAYDSQNSTLMDGSHADVHGAYVSGTTFAITNDTGGNMSYSQLTQTSGVFQFAFSYEAA